uniref:Uncharacterized protein n=1 Tax=Photinus pyralis TaxID=7054 RepID=A0A1Y1KKH5_PHOPY
MKIYSRNHSLLPDPENSFMKICFPRILPTLKFNFGKFPLKIFSQGTLIPFSEYCSPKKPARAGVFVPCNNSTLKNSSGNSPKEYSFTEEANEALPHNKIKKNLVSPEENSPKENSFTKDRYLSEYYPQKESLSE